VKITPFLWFDGKAEEAAQFYVSIFPKSKLKSLSRGPDGKVFSVIFRLGRQEFYALNGGPQYKFSPAISMFISCATQREVDRLWEKLSAGGKTNRCGWLDDKFGLTWQVVPAILGRYLQDKDRVKAGRVMQAMMGMEKFDIKGLKRAYAGS